MDNAALIERLNELGREVRTLHPLINHGGCCVYAALVGRELKRMGIESWGVVITDMFNPARNIDEVRKNIPPKLVKYGYRWNREGVVFAHIVLKFKLGGKRYIYDTSGVRYEDIVEMPFGFELCPGLLPVEDLEALAGVASNWNSDFDRREIPDVKGAVYAYLGSVS